MEKHLLALPNRCTGCNRCTYVCAAVKEGMFMPSKARLKINNFPLQGYSVPSVCFQCPKPDCLEACPEEAIFKNERGVVVVNAPMCNGCGDCVTACPYGMIEQYPDTGPITIRSLLTHSSGLPSESDYPYWSGPDFPFPSPEQVKAKLGTQKTLYPPSTYFQYSNLGLTLLGEIVAEVRQAVEDAAKFADEQPVPNGPDGLVNVFAEGAVPMHAT